MADEEQLAILKQGVEVWNKWREKEPDAKIDLNKANLRNADLREANLIEADLRQAKLNGARLNYAHLDRAYLGQADLCGTDLSEADLSGADLSTAHLSKANLSGAYLSEANLIGADLGGADLRGANLIEANLGEANLRAADLRGACFIEANLGEANLRAADLRGASLSRAYIRDVDLSVANISQAYLEGTDLSGAYLRDADLSTAHLRATTLKATFLGGADLSRADLSRAYLVEANLVEANLSGANLEGANLSNSNLVQVNINNAKLSKSNVYGVSVWDLEGEFQEQKDLIITPEGQPSITVDNIKVAQFIYLILNNREVRDVINTLTSKTVVILGRFAITKRKKILDALRNKLREYDLLPIVFDFDRPTDKDFTETIKTLASISYFVIADVTNPKSSPLELQATIPDYQIPFVPIIQEGEYPFAMMVDLQKKYNWVLDTISYDSLDTLLEILKPHIIDPAIKKRDELRLIKAKEPTVISGRELRNKKKLSE